MRVTNIGSNITEVQTDIAVVLVSYSTPVAAHITGIGYIKTEQYYSKTTSAHISKWLKSQGARNCATVSQSTLDNLIP